MEGKLILADGSVFWGTMLESMHTVGEVVFNTGMTGYQEVLTDPSYSGQIVTMTYPLIGNYGVAAYFNQSRRPYVRGFVIGELCYTPSNWRAESSLAEFLKRHRIPCLYGVDTRALTRRIRASGVMMGVLAPANMGHEEVLALLSNADVVHLVEKVTTPIVYRLPRTGPRVVVMDFGVKRNILESLARTGCDLTVVPATTTAETILAMEPDGVFLSNGPGDPKEVPYAIATVKKLVGKKPIFGICLGHQILALALGGDTYKLKFGHRGANHPVKDLIAGRVFITSQNHGYAVAEASLHGTDLVVTHRAVNDGTVEGIRHRTLPVFSVQYHPEAAPGPHDNMYLFQQFYQLMI